MCILYLLSAFVTKILLYLIPKYDNEFMGKSNTNISSLGGETPYL